MSNWLAIATVTNTLSRLLLGAATQAVPGASVSTDRPEVKTGRRPMDAAINVCPYQALTQVDDLQADPPTRTITLRYDTCIFCANCQDNCTTETGIKLSQQWDLAGLDRESMAEKHEYELQMCETCGALIGTKKHIVWLYEKLGPLEYANPSLLLAKSGELLKEPPQVKPPEGGTAQPSDFMRILCPKCKCELNIRL